MSQNRTPAPKADETTKPAEQESATAPAETTPAEQAAPEVEAPPEPPPAEEGPSLAKPELLGLIKITHPAGATSVSHNGQTYEADGDGVITVPNEAFAALADHGFVQA